MSGTPVTIVPEGGIPVVQSPNGTPVTEAPDSMAVTIVLSGGIPVTFIDADGNVVDPTEE